MVAMGIKVEPLQLQLIAFSSIAQVKKLFPQIDQVVKIFEDVQGVPMLCSKLIQAVPASIPLDARWLAINSPDTVVSYLRDTGPGNTVTTPENEPEGPLFYPSQDEQGTTYLENVETEESNGMSKLITVGIALYLFT
jgi:hypothetical protein